MAHVTHFETSEIIIRTAGADDADALAKVAARDGNVLPEGPALVAQVDGELRAAISLADGSVVADPFQRTAELVEMLKIRASRIRQPAGWRITGLRLADASSRRRTGVV